MLTYMDALSGAPRTPPCTETQQPLDRHGTDDVDEFGPAAQLACFDDVVLELASGREEEAIDVRDFEVVPDRSAGTLSYDAAAHAESMLESYRERAMIQGLGHSEWYDVCRRPLSDVLSFIEALEEPRAACASSSSRVP